MIIFIFQEIQPKRVKYFGGCRHSRGNFWVFRGLNRNKHKGPREAIKQAHPWCLIVQLTTSSLEECCNTVIGYFASLFFIFFFFFFFKFKCKRWWEWWWKPPYQWEWQKSWVGQGDPSLLSKRVNSESPPIQLFVDHVISFTSPTPYCLAFVGIVGKVQLSLLKSLMLGQWEGDRDRTHNWWGKMVIGNFQIKP